MGVGDLVSALRSMDRLLSLEEKHGRAIERLTVELDALKARVTRLEAREDLIVTEAKAASSAAASQVAMMSFSDIARRIGALEERTSRPQRYRAHGTTDRWTLIAEQPGACSPGSNAAPAVLEATWALQPWKGH